MFKPRIFISAVTQEFQTLRAKTATVLRQLGYEPVDQAVFGTEPGDLTPMLREKIDDCHGLIQLVGEAYGAEPPVADPEFGRVSYTQGEFLYARKRGIKTWLIFPGDGCTRDTPCDRLDWPADPQHSDPAAWRQERLALQEKYGCERRTSDHVWYDADDDTQFDLLLYRLNPEFARLRRRFRRWMTAAILLLALIAVGVVVNHFWVQHQLSRIEKNQQVNRERIRAHLLEAAIRVRAAALRDAESAPGWEERERLREAAEEAHRRTLTRIDRLVEDLSQIEGTEELPSVFLEMQRILAEEGIESALAFLDRRRSDVFAHVDDRREQSRTELRPYLIAADLKAVNGQPSAARQEFEGLLERDAHWPELLDRFARFLYDQSIAAETNGSLAAAVADAQQMLLVAERLPKAQSPSLRVLRLLGGALGRSGDVLVKRGQPGDAEQAFKHFTRCNELFEKLLRDNPGSAQAARDVSVGLNKLGAFLAQRGQPGDIDQALKHFTRSLELSEKLLRHNPGSAEAARDVSVILEDLGDFLARRGQPGDADQALKYFTGCHEALEKLLRANPGSAEAARDVSVSLNKLGRFLAQRGQPGDADQTLNHFTRSLELSEKLLQDNPGSAGAVRDVSGSLNTLGDFLAKRGQPGDADQALKHFTRSLELREKLFRHDPGSAQAARNVSLSLNKLGDFLVQRGQPGDADQALRHFTRCNEVLENLRQDNPGSAQATRDVSVSQEKLGNFLGQRGQPNDADQALKHFSRSLEFREKLLQDNRGSAEAARDVSVSLDRMGEILAQRGQPGDPEQALKHFTRSLELREKLLQDNPGSAQAARDVSLSLEGLGVLLARRSQPGNADQAFKHFTHSLELRKKLLQDNPGSAQANRDVSVILNKLGDLLAQRGQLGDAEQALKHFTRSLNVLEKLLQDNPGSAQAARDVAVSHGTLALFYFRAKDESAAQRHRRACYEVLHPRITRGMTFDPQTLQVYEILRAEFGEPASTAQNQGTGPE